MQNEVPAPDSTPPSDFANAGFLSANVNVEVERFREFFRSWVQLYLRVNHCAQTLLTRVEVKERDAVCLLVFSAYYRAVTTFQGVLLMVERGMDMEAKVLLRTLTDIALVVTASAKDNEFAKRYIRADEDSRRKLTKRLLSTANAASFLGIEQMAHLQKELGALEARKKAKGKDWEAQMRIEDIAKAAGLDDVYNQHFCYLSLFTHPGPLGMAQFLVQDAKGRITNFRTGRYDDDCESNMRVAIVMMLQTLSATSVSFKVDVANELHGFSDQLEKIIGDSHTQKLSA
jgi:hypothetical protein